MPPPPRLLIITDRGLVADLVATIELALGQGRAPGTLSDVAVLLREKDLSGRALLDLARRLRQVTLAAGARLLISDRVDIARAAGADGVHLPATGLPEGMIRAVWPEALIGRSTHDPDAAQAALRAGADYVTFGPVFETPSKRAYGPPPGLKGLRAACKAGPVIALGGITPSKAETVIQAGATGLACIRAILGARDPQEAVATFRAALAGA